MLFLSDGKIRLPFMFLSLVLCVLFFVMPIADYTPRGAGELTEEQLNAVPPVSALTALDLAIGGRYDYEGVRVRIDAEPLIFILMVIPVFILMLALNNVQGKILRNLSCIGLAAKVLFLFGTLSGLYLRKYTGELDLLPYVWIIPVLFAALILAAQFGLKSEKPVTPVARSAKVMSYSGICLALAIALSFVVIWRMPQGGSVTPLSMFFVAIIGWWFGPVVGVTAGIAFGLLRFTIRLEIYHPLQVILDYPLAYGALGLMGLFRGMGSKYAIHIGFTAAALCRAFMHYLSGVLFFQALIPKDWSFHPWLYSAFYNLSYILPDLIITLVIISIPTVYEALKRVSPDKGLLGSP
jgi:thiamine transporter